MYVGESRTFISWAISAPIIRKGTSPSELTFHATLHISRAQTRATSDNFDDVLACLMTSSMNLCPCASHVSITPSTVRAVLRHLPGNLLRTVVAGPEVGDLEIPRQML